MAREIRKYNLSETSYKRFLARAALVYDQENITEQDKNNIKYVMPEGEITFSHVDGRYRIITEGETRKNVDSLEGKLAIEPKGEAA